MGKHTSSISATTKDTELIVYGFKLHKNGLTPIGKPTFANWQECGTFIQEAEKSIQFWIGDWLNFGEKAWDKRYEEALEKTG